MECFEFFQLFTSCFRSSSSSPAADTDIPPLQLQEKYDVFISFRGEDTRLTFTSHLDVALCRNKIETYIDYRLVRGDEIAPALLEAIQRSTISVIIFSKNYASSSWCLDELVHILKCKEKNGQLVIPIFYDISPSDVRKQQGSYALAFRQLEKRFRYSIDKVHKWRAALTQAADLSGFDDSQKTESEAALVKKVVDDIWTKLIHESSCDLKGLVGIKSRIHQIESLLCLDTPGVLCVDIWGMGGIGKTTLAEAVFHRNSSKFEACSLLKNVREKSEQTDGLEHLKKTLLSDILKEKNLSMGSTFVRQRLSRTKVLIVFDDVTDSRQIERLNADHVEYGPGSRIIITTRDRSILMKTVEDDKMFKLEELKLDDALQLFRFHAFKDSSTTTDYTDVSAMVVANAGGNPLALKVMGSSFLPFKSKKEWEDQLNNLKRFQNKEIEKVLRISYDGLEENEKEIFLDIACFHKGNNRNDVKRMLDSCGFFAEAGIKVLIQRSLISISKWASIEMHDLLQEMGRAIVGQPCIEERSRLFITKDVYQALINDQIAVHAHAISFDWSKIKKLHLKHANFAKMYQLRCLLVVYLSRRTDPWSGSLDLPNSLKYLDWVRYPLKSLPSKFSAQNVVVLNMPFCKATGAQLWTKEQNPVNLKRISLAFSNYLTEVPNLSWSLEIDHINLYGCESLVEIPSYFQHLGNLTYLDLGRCINLKSLPEMPCNLEFLNLHQTAIQELPSSIWSHEKISHLDITCCKHLKRLPSNTCKLKLSGSFSLEGCKSLCEFWELPKNTTAIKLFACKNLVSLPMIIWKLKSLGSLDLNHCSKFQYFSEISEAMEHLEFLNLSGTAVREVPPSIGNLVVLRKLDLGGCDNLVSLPTNIWTLKSLESLDLSSCFKFQNFPDVSEAMEHLEFLNLSHTAVKEVPPTIGNLVALRKLDLSHCKNLEVVPDYLFCLTSLQELNLSFTKIKSIPTSIKRAAQLSHLCLIGCESLESLPELPPSLKTVSSSLTEGRGEHRFSQGLHEKHIKVLPTSNKYLERLDLSSCSKFQYFPKISEAMEHLEFLKLSGTAVKELHPSIENLVALRKLDLSYCNNLVSLPTNIWKLKLLESLTLSHCSKFQFFPDILEPMEHQEFLVALQKLDLSHCKNLEVVPNCLFCSTSLQELNLSSAGIKSIPASIKQAAQLSRLFLNDCKSLESLPELPPLLLCLEAHFCTSLKTVSSSSTAITQGWEEYIFPRGLHEKHIFLACSKLDHNAQSNIMADAQLRIMRMATASPKFKSYEFEQEFFAIRCSGNNIPKWFSHQSKGSSIKIKLPRDWFSTDFLGFALSVVGAYAPFMSKMRTRIGCEYNFKTSNGESHEVKHHLWFWGNEDSREVFVWWYNNVFGEAVEEARRPTAFYNRFTEVNVDFNVMWDMSYYGQKHLPMEKCGICMLYGKDAEKIKKRAV